MAASDLAGLGLAALATVLPPADPAVGFRVHLVARTGQPGVVGYRDPLGVVSPDGTLLAFTSGRHLRLRRVEGGPVSELGPADRNLTHIAWLPDSRHLASFGRNPDTGEASWVLHDVVGGSRQPLWPGQAGTARVRHLSWAENGTSVGISLRDGGTDLVKLAADGTVVETTASALRLSYPSSSPDGHSVACLALVDGRPRVSLPCGTPSDTEAYGPVAFSPDGGSLYYAAPNDRGTLDLWSRSLPNGRAERLTSFTRDAYAPSVTRAGEVLFKVQDYAVHVATVPAAGGAASLVASFQSETPSWHPSGREIGITYGSWRRFMDDFHYPDIAQDIGVVSLDLALPARAPARVLSATASEDQSVCWSPNGRFMALHSHFGPSDDVFLVPADLSRPPRQISTGGSETGWPRWSPDGRHIVFTTDTARLQPSARGLPSWERPRERNAIIVIGVDQESGEVTEEQREVPLGDFQGQPLHVEWAPDSRRLFFDSNDGDDRRSLNTVAREGGRVTRLHAFESEEGFSGIGASPDGRSLAFIAPARDGFAQIFVVPSTGGTPVQVTSDPSHKTQPSFSPDGKTIALTVWRYEVELFSLGRR